MMSLASSSRCRRDGDTVGSCVLAGGDPGAVNCEASMISMPGSEIDGEGELEGRDESRGSTPDSWRT